MKKNSVQCRGIRLAYGNNEVLKNINVDIQPGEFFALLGPSGSGKSTLLRLIAGFNQHQHGELLIDGRDVTGMPPWERNVGMVFQSYALWPHLTVWDNVAFGLVERRVPKAEQARKVEQALATVGLERFAQRRPGQLSGGQQQRVALARTIVIEPQVLLLDEPLSNLDKSLRVQMRQELLALQRRLGITTIFVTHDQEEAMTTADRMAVLDKGVVQQVGSPRELYDHPVNEFVASFVGTMNLLPGTVQSHEGQQLTLDLDGVGLVQLPATAGAPVRGRAVLSFRPHALQIDGAPPAGDARHLWMRGVVEASEFLGEATRYQVRVGTQSLSVDQPHHRGVDRFAAGSSVGIGLERSQARLLPI
ncbi:ABC transporter ATP-binding protein [Pseudorhodoferax sp. Leaf267]|uniref:ABC transporter ATP-binding protein n=1 Tax=Pseudorhodoferax sp. Leaf267 TaxID=1736316 RepID=UPI0006F38E59|nr:ABC transporter ATP-binding protein [Pseudorhodoferax sp. Leaf267]KQP13178.1 ABC transporter ATP-binding protein [Pseudorhodoferax sp. Leaf267]